MEFREPDPENIKHNRKWEKSRDTLMLLDACRPFQQKNLQVYMKVRQDFKKSWITNPLPFLSVTCLLVIQWLKSRSRLGQGQTADSWHLVLRKIVEFAFRKEYGSSFTVCPDSFHATMKRYGSLILVPCLYSLETFEQQNILINNLSFELKTRFWNSQSSF